MLSYIKKYDEAISNRSYDIHKSKCLAEMGCQCRKRNVLSNRKCYDPHFNILDSNSDPRTLAYALACYVKPHSADNRDREGN